MSEPVRPNFIVGALKCGTASMHEYLAEQPVIFMAEHKELHYFGKDLRFRHRPNLQAYLRNFENAQGYDIGSRPPMDVQLRRRLQQEMAPQIRDLASVLGRDLSDWLEPKGKTTS